jgi:hypothetical protein
MFVWLDELGLGLGGLPSNHYLVFSCEELFAFGELLTDVGRTWVAAYASGLGRVSIDRSLIMLDESFPDPLGLIRLD